MNQHTPYVGVPAKENRSFWLKLSAIAAICAGLLWALNLYSKQVQSMRENSHSNQVEEVLGKN